MKDCLGGTVLGGIVGYFVGTTLVGEQKQENNTKAESLGTKEMTGFTNKEVFDTYV